MQNILLSLQQFNLLTAFKIAFLIMVGLYSLFAIMLYNQIQALSKIIFFPSQTSKTMIKLFSAIYIFLIVSLFFITLVIV